MGCALVVLAGLAGCLGDGDKGTQDNDGTTSGTRTNGATNATSTTNGTGPPGGNGTGNSTGNGTTNGTGQEPAATWTLDNRTGTVSGNDLVVTPPPSASETFDVANGTLALALNLSAEGDELTLTARPPGCDAADCELEVQTQSGRARLSQEVPAEGTWTVTLTAQGPGPVSSNYALEIAQLVPDT